MNIQRDSAKPDELPNRRIVDRAVVRFAGDSGDGVQITGSRLGVEAALGGSDLATFPDFPSEIRAPKGSLAGVSSLQVQFASLDIHTPGDLADCLVAFNPAALKTNLDKLRQGGLLIVDTTTFTGRDVARAGFDEDPLAEESLDGFRVIAEDLTGRTVAAVAATPGLEGASKKEVERAKNFYALGLVLWLFDRSVDFTLSWIETKFAKSPEIAAINRVALGAGYAIGKEAAEAAGFEPVAVGRAEFAKGRYRTITGNDAIAYGLAAGALSLGLEPVYCSYPITPASTILHSLTALGPAIGVRTFQAEDEIAAICAAIGASYAGSIGITGTSGPGMALKTEAMGLAFAAELPLVIVNVQRGGPSTGLPTKAEQSDLFQAVMGRNADTPVPVLAVREPAEGFEVAREAVRLAVRHMTPVIVLSDGYLANASEPWRLPDLSEMASETVDPHQAPEGFAPFRRDPATLARPWVAPGAAGGIHRLGGLEREDVTGDVSYDPVNHQRMTALRLEKFHRVADDVPLQDVAQGDAYGAAAVVGWGSTYGAISEAVRELRDRGHLVSHIHMRHLAPFPRNIETLLRDFGRIIVPEMNAGQLAGLLRRDLLVPAEALTKVAGQPFLVNEIVEVVEEALGGVAS